MTTERIDIVVGERGSRVVSRNLKDLGDQSKLAGLGVDSLKGALKGLTVSLSIGAALSFATREVIAFSRAIAEVRSIVDTTTFDLDKLTQAVYEQSAAFGAAPADQMKAAYELLSSGAETAEQAIDQLTVANMLAVGGVTDVMTAADGLTSVLNAYVGKIESATDASDAMFLAVRAGKTTVAELSSSLGKVTPIASQLNVSFDELLSAIAALTKGGISTAESVTGVRAILASVAKPTKEASDLAQSLGLEFNTAGLQAKGFAGFMREVMDKTGGSTDQLALLFGGVEALVPAMALAGAAGKDFEAIMEDMGDKAGLTEAAFNELANSPGFQLQRILSTAKVEVLQLAMGLGTALVPVLRALADGLTFASEAFVTLAAVTATYFALIRTNAILTMIPQLIALERALGAATLRQALMGVASKQLAGSLGIVSVAFRGVTAAMMANPFIAVAAVVVGLVTLLYQLRDATVSYGQHSATVGNLAGVLWDRAKAKLAGLGEVFKVFYEGFNARFKKMAEWAGLKFKDIAEFGRWAVNMLIGLWVAWREYMIGIFKAVWEVAKATFQGIIDMGRDAISALAALKDGDFAGAKAAFGQVFSGDNWDFSGVEASIAESAGKVSAAVGKDYVGAIGDYVDGVFTDAEARAAQFNTNVTDPAIPAVPSLPGEGQGGAGGGGGLGKADLTKGIETENAALEAQKQLLEDIKKPAQDYALQTSALSELLAQGAITADEFAVKLRDVSIQFLSTQTDWLSGAQRAMLTLEKEYEDLAKGIETTITNAFKGAEDAIVNFATTGKLDFKSFANSIISDMIRMAVRASIMKPLLNMVGQWVPGLTAAAPAAPGVPNYATGGDFVVGGRGGVDSQMVAFRASPGERVSITRPGQGESGSKGSTVVFNISTPDVEGFRRSESQIASRMQRLAARGQRNS